MLRAGAIALRDIACFGHNIVYAGNIRSVKLSKEEATNFVIIVDQREDGLPIVECPSISGCVSQGKTDKRP